MSTKLPDDSEDYSWDFYTYPIDAPASAFAEFAPMIDLWRSKCRDGARYPAWRDFELLDFEGWWGQLALGEIDEVNGSVVFVLWGTQLTTWWGLDLTQKNIVLISSLKSPAYEAQIDYYRAMFSGERIGFNSGTMESSDRPFLRVKMIELPLSNNGETPTHIFSVAAPVDFDDQSSPSIAALPIPQISTSDES